AVSGDWWRDAFGAGYAEVYAHRDDASAAAEVAGLLPRLRAAPGPVLDAGCGNGRHLAALRQAGIAAYGFDFSRAQLESARERPSIAGRLACADLRAPPLADAAWGAVVLLFTGFGYFSDAENAATLARLARLLAPGGWLVVDQPDPEHVRRTLVARSERRLEDGTVVIERRSLTGHRVEKEVEIVCAGATRTWRESVRLYDDTEMRELARDCGLEPVERWGCVTGAEKSSARHVHWLQRR
ncbi:MAG: methyltransferase domain-containing protein, partial [Planctomycetes bacterium]|nr:methyltransferase domain-containing protein [Planctomycetota bacterium]